MSVKLTIKETIYTVDFAPRVEDQLKIIPRETRTNMLDWIKKLEKNPRPHNIEPLKGADKGLFRVRQGDYRIFQKLLVLIVRVVHRKEVYEKKHSK